MLSATKTHVSGTEYLAVTMPRDLPTARVRMPEG